MLNGTTDDKEYSMYPSENNSIKTVKTPLSWLSKAGVLRACAIAVAVIVLAIFVGRAIAQESWWLPTSILLIVLLLLILLTHSLSRMLLWWIALGPLLARWGGVELGMGVPNITFDRLMLGILVLLTIKEVIGVHSKQQLQCQSITSADLSLGLWGLFYVVSVLLRSQSITTDLFNINQIVILPMTTYYIARALFRTEEARNHLVRVLSLVAMYLAVGVLYEQITHTAITSSGSGMSRLSGLMRSGSFLAAPWTLGYVLLLILPIMFYAEHTMQKRIQKGFYRLVILVILLSVFFTYIRSVWIALVLQMFFLAVVFPKWRRIILGLALALAITLIGIWPTLSRSDAVSMQLGNPTNLLGRIEVGTTQWHRFLKQPWFGFGGSQGRIGIEGIASHNTWLVMLVEVGLIGTIPLLLFVGSAVWRRVRILRMTGLPTTSRRWSAVLLISVIPCGVVSNAVDLTYFSFELALTFFYLSLLMRSGWQSL